MWLLLLTLLQSRQILRRQGWQLRAGTRRRTWTTQVMGWVRCSIDLLNLETRSPTCSLKALEKVLAATIWTLVGRGKASWCICLTSISCQGEDRPGTMSPSPMLDPLELLFLLPFSPPESTRREVLTAWWEVRRTCDLLQGCENPRDLRRAIHQ